MDSSPASSLIYHWQIVPLQYFIVQFIIVTDSSVKFISGRPKISSGLGHTYDFKRGSCNLLLADIFAFLCHHMTEKFSGSTLNPKHSITMVLVESGGHVVVVYHYSILRHIWTSLQCEPCSRHVLSTQLPEKPRVTIPGLWRLPRAHLTLQS